MAYSRGYMRIFVTLQQDCGDYSLSLKQAMGRGIIEVRNGQGRLMIYGQGLKPEVMYKVCMLGEESCAKAPNIVEADKSGKCEYRWGFEPDNIAGSGLKIEDIRAVAILVDEKAPLIGYIKGAYDWHRCVEKKSLAETIESVREQAEAEEAVLLSEESNKDEHIKAENEIKEISDGLIEPDIEAVENAIELIESTDDNKDKDKALKEERIEFIQEEKEDEPKDGFKSIIFQFNKDIEELKYYANINADTKRDIDYIFDKYIQVKPFGDDNIKWIKINLRELAIVGNDMWKYMNNPFVTYGCKKYKHLILGREMNGNEEYYSLGVPCEYDPQYKLEASMQGFDGYKSCDGKKLNKGDFCYCILRI